MNNKKYNVLDLFAGIGGMSLGFKSFTNDDCKPFNIVAAVELDKNAANTLVAALIREGVPPEDAEKRVICDDITKNETKDLIKQRCPHVDIIIGGPPCQSFSMIGPRSGDKKKQERFSKDMRDNLFEHYIDLVEHFEPAFFVFENVKGILSKKNEDGTKFIDIIIKRFEDIGYHLNVQGEHDKKYMLLNAVDYGVPQNRERVIIIGNRMKKDNPTPQKTHCHPDKSIESGLLPFVTVRDAIGDLPRVQAKLTYTPMEKSNSRKRVAVNKDRKERIDERNKTIDDGVDRQSYPWPNFYRHYLSGGLNRQKFLDSIKPNPDQDPLLIGHKARSQQESDVLLFENMDEGMIAKDLFNSTNPKHMELARLIKYTMSSFEDKYKKLRWDEPSNTIVAHLQKDGNRYIHPDGTQARTLTVREAARLQSFPDDYEIKAGGNIRYKYIGNAVPPLLSYAIAKSVFNSLIQDSDTGGESVTPNKNAIPQ